MVATRKGNKACFRACGDGNHHKLINKYLQRFAKLYSDLGDCFFHQRTRVGALKALFLQGILILDLGSNQGSTDQSFLIQIICSKPK